MEYHILDLENIKILSKKRNKIQKFEYINIEKCLKACIKKAECLKTFCFKFCLGKQGLQEKYYKNIAKNWQIC